MPQYPPGPSSLAALRSMMPAPGMSGFPAFLRRTAGRYGPLASTRMPRLRFFYVNEPELIEQVLVTDGRSFVKGRGAARLAPLLGRGLLITNGPEHLRQRRLVQPAFHRERIAEYAATMAARATGFAESLEAGAAIDIDTAMSRLTLGIAAETLFGARVDDQADAIGRALRVAMESFPLSLSPVGEVLDHLPWLPIMRRFRAARAELDAIVYGVIDARLHASDPARGHDVLAMLLAARNDDGEPMDRELLRDQVITIFLAGYETTAMALTWTWWLLAQHPAAEAKMHREILDVLGDRTPAIDDVPALRFTRDVAAEAMRLYPPAWLIGRRAIADVRLGEWTVPTGSVAITSPWLTHREGRYWREPEAFRPERWSNGETDALPKFAYFPFGGGTRICIGEAFAWTELVLVLAIVARRWRFTLASPGEAALQPQPSVTLRPGRHVRLSVRGR